MIIFDNVIMIIFDNIIMMIFDNLIMIIFDNIQCANGFYVRTAPYNVCTVLQYTVQCTAYSVHKVYVCIGIYYSEKYKKLLFST